MPCCVQGCKAKDVVFFGLPNSKSRCKKWQESIKLRSKPTCKSVVCSAHFRPEDYGVVRGKVRLKPKVLPIPQNGAQKPVQVKRQRQTRNKSSNMDISENGVGESGPTETEAPNESELVNGDMGEEATELNTGAVPNENQRRESNGNSSRLELSESSSENYTEPKLNKGTDKDDIENILTNYYIKQNKEIADRQTEELIKEKSNEQCNTVEGDHGRSCEVIDLSQQNDEAQPVIIEVPAEHDSQDAGARDCLMLLESVQVELDPNDLMLSDREDDKKQSESISLLTSSDEDDVIIQEPRVDTVVVSDATDDEVVGGADDEEDVPLVRLASLRPRPRNRAPNPFYRQNGRGLYQYYCHRCPYRTTRNTEYQEHMVTHSTVVLVCSKCEYITASKTHYIRHKKMHDEQWRYRCRLCEYRARHRTRLVNHLQRHERAGDKFREFKCDLCGFVSKVRRFLVRHVRICAALTQAQIRPSAALTSSGTSCADN